MIEKGQSAVLEPDVSYDILIRRCGAKYHLYIRELCLWSSAEKLEVAHREIQEKVAAKIASYVDAGADHEIPPPRRVSRKSRFREETKIFAVRAAIVTGCCAFLVAVMLSLLTAYLSPLRSILALTDSMLRHAQTSEGAASALDRIATSIENIPIEQREKAVADLRRIVRAVEPFAVELRPLLEADPPPSEQRR